MARSVLSLTTALKELREELVSNIGTLPVVTPAYIPSSTGTKNSKILYQTPCSHNHLQYTSLLVPENKKMESLYGSSLKAS